jgi:SpoVK/Ycf46/Vps4 family AAA+-type ATPase
LVTNEPLQFPFKIRTIKFEPVDAYEAKHITESFIQLYTDAGYNVKFNESQIKQVIRKLCGTTYTEAADSFSEALSNRAETNKFIDPIRVVKNLRERVNRNLMEGSAGLTHLTPKPWGDYICSENSNFTFDVKKIVRDFNEIDLLKEEEKKILKDGAGDNSIIVKKMDAIRARMPHVIILYGKGGLGKSAFPIHFAGLLDFDAWDFNINASHSKWIGEGAENMRKAIARISKASHVVVRIDEYDRAIGVTGASGQGMHEAHKQVEAEFMNWLQNGQEDNLFSKNDIFIVLTTNHKDNITGPLLRSGRADLVIDINEFDDKSMKEAFLSSPRRMKNRDLLPPVGYDDFDSLLRDIQKLDLDKMVPLASQKGFTVRDIDTLIIEMAAHNYYFNKNKQGIPWTTEMFIKVLENSTGSTKGEDTSELVLGDRFIADKEDKKAEDPQIEFGFAKEYTAKFDLDKFVDVNFFK